MLNNWFYSHSTWTVAFAVCAVLIVVALAGLVVFHRFVNWHAREEDTSMTGLSYALCGGIYAVVLAFVAVGVYEAMDKSTEIASEEANSLSALSFNSPGLPAELAARIRDGVNVYIDTVTKKEWPAQQAYHMEENNYEDGWDQLRKLNLELANFEPTSPGQATVKAEMLHASNDLYSARRARLLAANQHLPEAVWQMLIVGLVFVVFFLYLFGPHSFGIHMAAVGMTMLSVGLVFTLIIALDYPFRGDLSVDDESYVAVKELSAHTFGHHEGAPAAEHEEKK
jgi:Protein of unknown function (DUF4239)